MRSPSQRSFFSTGLYIVFTVIAFWLVSTSPAKADPKKGADTVSSNDVQFTTIPSTADSIAIIKQMNATRKATQQALANAQAVMAKAKAVSADKPKTLWELFFEGLAGGFLAFLLPCIYPLLPLTVSFFLKLGGNRLKATGLSIIYGLSIIVIYVSLGLLITILFGPSALNGLATNGVFNILLFALLVVFAVSFFGAFEIVLPSSFVNKIDQQSNRDGLIGIFFMALTLVVVSFSCTGLVIGGELANVFTKGERLGPAVCMFGFSLALSLPFMAFALFPSALKSLPKSGGWLNSVKVVLGFIELALALKFLSNVDLAYHWNWLDREIFLSLWIAIGLLMGLYLIGKIKFAHDSEITSLSIPRVFLSIIVFAFVVYMIPGLWGAPLKFISAYLPPIATQDFDLSPIPGSSGASNTTQPSTEVRKYANNYLRIKTRGLDAWYDYDQALEASKRLHKPIFIDFTGFNCVNCRKMEADVWSDPRVFNHLKNDFILLQLVVDDKADLDPKEQFKSSYSGKMITTFGGKWSDLETYRFNSNSQPFYVMLDSDGNMLTDKNDKVIPPSPADYVIGSYLKFLESGIAAYKK